MYLSTPAASVIVTHTINQALLEDVFQAQLHAEAILAVNDDHAIEPGHLQGMSLMLTNAVHTVFEACAALPAAHPCQAVSPA